MPLTAEFAVLESWPDAVLVLDAGARVVFASRAAVALAGRDEPLDALLPEHATLLGRLCAPASELPPPLVWPWQGDHGEPVRVEHRFQRLGDGSLLVVARPLGDLVPRAELEEEQRLLERRLLHAQKTESLAVLAGGLAHEFNNLLTAVLGNVELLRREQPSSTSRGYLEQIERLAGRAADLCQQMLAYAGKGRFFLESVALEHVVATTLPILQTTLPASTRIALELAPDLPRLEADANQMRQLVINLVLNASEALEGRKGTVTVRSGLLTLAPTDPGWLGDQPPRGCYATLQIRDTGSGMTPEVLGRIFDPFFTTRFPGRGLGLSAVLGIVRSHRGVLRVESVPGQGSTFTVALPLPNLPLASPSASGRPAPQPADLTVLIVDDDDSIRHLVVRILESVGYRTLVAETGQQALDRLATGVGVDLVLLDLTMPGLSGEETLHEIRKRWPGLRVLLMSGFSSGESEADSEGDGAVGFLPKPFRPAQLLERVRQALEPQGPAVVG